MGRNAGAGDNAPAGFSHRRQSLATARPAPGQDSPAAICLHAGPESEPADALAIALLNANFHLSSLPYYIFRVAYATRNALTPQRCNLPAL